jgi:hypothetical protein
MSHTSGVLDNVFRVQDSGDVFAASYNTGGADFAESFSVRGAKTLYGAGDVLVIDQTSNRRLTRSTKSYSTLVAGIYSTQPGVLASPYKMGQTPASDVPLAVVGVVPCKVTTENGDIRAGDLLVTSHQAGYAMKGTDRHRMIVAILRPTASSPCVRQRASSLCGEPRTSRAVTLCPTLRKDLPLIPMRRGILHNRITCRFRTEPRRTPTNAHSSFGSAVLKIERNCSASFGSSTGAV